MESILPHSKMAWRCSNVAVVDDDVAREEEVDLHEHLAAVAGHGGPPLAQLLHQAGHNMLPAPASASALLCSGA